MTANRQQAEGRAGDGDAFPNKAMILAAGSGTRLLPLTREMSKCMIPIAGKPILEHTIDHLARYGVRQLVVNLHHLPESVVDYFGDGSRWNVSVTYSVEDVVLGTAGGVKKASSFFDGPFFVWYGDNLSNCRLDRLWQFHRHKEALVTVALSYRQDPTQSGIVALDQTDRVTRFLEKPKPELVFSHWVNAGVFVLEPAVLEAIPSDTFLDFGRDVLPSLVASGRPVFGYRMAEDEGLWWIDTPEDLARVQGEWEVES